MVRYSIFNPDYIVWRFLPDGSAAIPADQLFTISPSRFPMRYALFTNLLFLLLAIYLNLAIRLN